MQLFEILPLKHLQWYPHLLPIPQLTLIFDYLLIIGVLFENGLEEILCMESEAMHFLQSYVVTIGPMLINNFIVANHLVTLYLMDDFVMPH